MHHSRGFRRALGAALALGLATAAPPLARADEDARAYVQFVEDLSGTCSARSAKLIEVRNTHPTRTLRVWLDRYHMGHGTGDRSRSELAPGAEPEALGCSRTTDGPQEWRVVRAVFVN
ncbi:MAG TPA: hypothetical protein VLU41_02975 [Ideonella sp.]|nr:hypothetical protein [Ideonella sp.]